MKKLLMSTLAVVLAVAAVQAQEIPERKEDGRRPHARHRAMKHHRGMAMEKLNLTDAQKEQFRVQRENMRKQVEELKKNENITVKEWKSRMETLRKDNKDNMQRILTDDQKAQIEKMRTEGREKREAMMKKRGEMMSNRLGLSEEQSARLEKNRAAMKEQFKAIRENKSLSGEQKKEQFRALHQKQKEQLKSVLTEEQLKQLKERKHEGPRRKKEGPKDKETI